MSEITAESLVITGRKRGRPRLEDTDVVHVRLRASLHERACQAAELKGVSVREFIRESIRLGIYVTTKSSRR